MSSIDYRYRATVLRVIDGDTIVALVDLGFHTSREIHLRLDGYDAPEIRGPEKVLGKKATQVLLHYLPEGAECIIQTGKGKTFDRWIADVFTVDGFSINSRMKTWCEQNMKNLKWGYVKKKKVIHETKE